MAEGKPKRRGIGSISQFATLGNKAPEDQSTEITCSPDAVGSKPLNAKDPRPLDSKTTETQAAQTSSSLESKELENLSTQEPSGQSVEVSENQSTQESKRLIQISEEELKRLMVEALQSQSTQAPKQQEKPKRLRQTVYLEPDLHKQVRHRIADTGEDISDVVNLALRQLLSHQ